MTTAADFLLKYTATPINPEFEFKKNGIYCECNSLGELNDSYVISVTKDDKGWVVFGEDHEPSEISKMYNVPVFFKTKKQAIKVAQELAEDMYTCTFNNIYEND
jgi:hypothetical protein